jgi:hypothetical protein
MQNLPREVKERTNCIAPFNPKRHHGRGRGFDDSKDLSRSHGRSGVIEDFARSRQVKHVAAQGADHLTGEPEGTGIAFDDESAALQRGNADAGKCLERMHRTDGSTERAERLKDLGIKGATCMQNSFPFPVFRKELSQAFRNVRNRGIRRGDQNVARRQGLPRNSGKSVSLSYESNGAARGRLGARDDAKDFPARFA